MKSDNLVGFSATSCQYVVALIPVHGGSGFVFWTGTGFGSQSGFRQNEKNDSFVS